jgi:hypothetical protein
LTDFVYIGDEPVEVRNLARFVGWHETFLNNAQYSYEVGDVEDWVEFFKEEWAAVMCHDNFPTFVATLRDSLASDKGVFYVMDKLAEMTEGTIEMAMISKSRKDLIGNRGEHVPVMTKKAIEKLTMEFVKRNKTMFPKFYLPKPGGYKKK